MLHYNIFSNGSAVIIKITSDKKVKRHSVPPKADLCTTLYAVRHVNYEKQINRVTLLKPEWNALCIIDIGL